MERKKYIFKQVNSEVLENWRNNKKQVFNLFDCVINHFILNNLLIFFITINKDHLYNKLKDDIDYNISFILDTLWQDKYQTEFTLVLPELNSNKIDHYHLIFCMRTMINYNDHVLKNLTNSLRLDISNDTHVERLYNFEQIKRKFIYLLKDTYVDELNLQDMLNYKENNLYFLKFTISLENAFFLQPLKDLFTSVGLKKNINYKQLNIHSWGSCNEQNEDKFSRKTILLILQHFISINNILIRNNSVYVKLKNTFISYKKVGDLGWFFQTLNLIYNFMLNLYPINFYGLNINSIALDFTHNKEIIEKYIKQDNKVKFDFSVLEFKDGLYFMKEDKFVLREKLSPNLNLYTIKFYDKNYNSERQKKPVEWIKAIEYVTNFKEGSEEFEEFCSRIANLVIKNQQVSGKKKVLYIWGDSNAGKTTIIARPLWKFFEQENIGIISGNSNFAYDYVVDKELVIWDEAIIEKKKREEILKFFENQPIVANRKYKQQTILTNIEKVALSNYSLEPKENKKLKHSKSYTDDAIYNRVYSVKFEPQFENKEQHDAKMQAIMLNIDNEDPSIMLYCNKILTKKYGKTKMWYTTLLKYQSYVHNTFEKFEVE